VRCVTSFFEDEQMITFQVANMTCGHCVDTITKAVKAIDGEARVQIDLAGRRVAIESGNSDVAALREAIERAGYTPVAAGASQPTQRPPAQRGGCCCG
jgi:copper chaperone